VQPETQITLNGLDLTVDNASGAIIRMEVPGLGVLLDTTPDLGSLIDMAYPVSRFDPLRLATRFSTGVSVEKQDDALRIHIPSLGYSRPGYEVDGFVAAEVDIRASEDGRSVIMQCRIENNSDNAVPQVLFPDFMGLLDFVGDQSTEFRTCGFVSKPFAQLKTPPGGSCGYNGDPSVAGIEYSPGDYMGTSATVLRWMDFGGLEGGFSLFPKLWSWGPNGEWPIFDKFFLKLNQDSGKLRLAYAHKVMIAPGEAWMSPEFYLTPHKHGWAEGIKTYDKWVKQNYYRAFPIPNHIREDIGFRTLWMSEQFDDPASVVWKFSDLPMLARDAKEHGITEMVLWGAIPYFQVPFDSPYASVGTEDDLVEAVRECKEIGVHVNLFFSAVTLSEPSLHRYRPCPKDREDRRYHSENGWTYHSQFIPSTCPYYGNVSRWMWVDQTDENWQEDLFASIKRLIDRGCVSFCWDQFVGLPIDPNVYTVATRLRQAALSVDPKAAFGGESCNNMEACTPYLDFTWTWTHPSGGDYQPFMRVLPAPRLNVNVNHSSRGVKECFMDNMFLNAYPSRPGGVDGSALISDYPDYSRTIKQCVTLRKRFLSYFTDGENIGDCILARKCGGARITAHCLPDSALVILMPNGAGPVEFSYDLAPWIEKRGSAMRLKCVDIEGSCLVEEDVAVSGSLVTSPIAPEALLVYEFKSIG